MRSELQNARRNGSALTFDLHPLYATILQDGATVREGEVLGLDVELRQVLVAPFTGTVRFLITGHGDTRRVKVFLTEQNATAHRNTPFIVRDTANYLHESRN